MSRGFHGQLVTFVYNSPLYLSILDRGQAAITLFGEEDADNRIAFIYESGGWLIFNSGDDTYLCIGSGQAGHCEKDENGYLQFVE